MKKWLARSLWLMTAGMVFGAAALFWAAFSESELEEEEKEEKKK